MKEFFKKLWNGWKKIAHKIGRFQTRLIITIFYFIILAPLGAVMRLFGWDPLETGGFNSEKVASNWKKIEQSQPGLEELKRQS